MNKIELQDHLEKCGYEFKGVQHYKKHDALYFAKPPGITYGRLQLSARVEDVPDETWLKYFTSDTSEKRLPEETS